MSEKAVSVALYDCVSAAGRQSVFATETQPVVLCLLSKFVAMQATNCSEVS
jgi:hypothetical protein